MKLKLLEVVNTIRAAKSLPSLNDLQPEMRLRDDLSMDSLDLAELTVKIEDLTGIDIFSSSTPATVDDVLAQLKRSPAQ
jgi:acyl carrier protein